MLNHLFNLFRAALMLILITVFPLTELIQSLTPGDVGHQVANTHTIFAILAVLLEVPFRQPDSRAFQKSGPCPAGRKPFRRGQKAPLSCTDCGSSFFDGNTAGQAGTGQDGAAGPGLPAEGCGLLLYPG